MRRYFVLEKESGKRMQIDPAKMKEVQGKIDSLEKQAKDLADQLAAAQKARTEIENDQKDLKKVSELLTADNERLETALRDQKAGYDKASAKMDSVKAARPALGHVKKVLQGLRGKLKALRADLQAKMDAASP